MKNILALVAILVLCMGAYADEQPLQALPPVCTGKACQATKAATTAFPQPMPGTAAGAVCQPTFVRWQPLRNWLAAVRQPRCNCK